MAELKPCPFCGGKAGMSHGVDRIGHEYFFVGCDTCFCKTPNFYKWRYGEAYRQEAIEAWNRRAEDGKT